MSGQNNKKTTTVFTVVATPDEAEGIAHFISNKWGLEAAVSGYDATTSPMKAQISVTYTYSVNVGYDLEDVLNYLNKFKSTQKSKVATSV